MDEAATQDEIRRLKEQLAQAEAALAERDELYDPEQEDRDVTTRI
jgi:hypothetical protein